MGIERKRRTMKVLLILAWAAVAINILWWPRPPSFDRRFVQLPPAMSWNLISKAPKAAARPMFVAHCQWPACRFS
jgi:hypothetical protein